MAQITFAGWHRVGRWSSEPGPWKTLLGGGERTGAQGEKWPSNSAFRLTKISRGCRNGNRVNGKLKQGFGALSWSLFFLLQPAAHGIFSALWMETASFHMLSWKIFEFSLTADLSFTPYSCLVKNSHYAEQSGVVLNPHHPFPPVNKPCVVILLIKTIGFPWNCTISILPGFKSTAFVCYHFPQFSFNICLTCTLSHMAGTSAQVCFPNHRISNNSSLANNFFLAPPPGA